MKILVAFYSRTGNTKKLGEMIAKSLNADIDEIIDKKNRSGIIGWLGGVKDVLFKKPTEIENKKKSEEYDLVIIGTPVWVGNIVPAIRAYLSKNRFNHTAFFCTYGSNEGKTFNEMEQLSSKPVSVLGLKTKNINDSKEKTEKFCISLKAK